MDQSRMARAPALTSRTRAAVVVLAAGAMLPTTGPALALSWTTVPSPSEVPGDNYLYGADASDAGDVWAVGAVFAPTAGTRHGLVLRHDGAAWRSVSRRDNLAWLKLMRSRATSRADVSPATNRPSRRVTTWA